MNFKLYTRPFSSENLRKNLNIYGQSSPINSSSKQPTHRPQISQNESEKVLSSQRSLAQDYYNSPENSQYEIQLFFPSRPETSHLSGLTHKENQRSLIQSSSLTQFFSYKSLEVTRPDTIWKMPSEKDFTKILTKLEMVSSNRTSGHKRILINDGENFEILLDSGSVQYFSINSKGQKPPLSVNIKRTKGKVISYVSKINPEPSRGMCDNIFKTDTFQVNDISPKFKNEAIFLAIEGINEAIITVFINFGRRITIKKASNLKFTQEEQEIIKMPETAALTTRKKKEFVENEKNFIKINTKHSKNKL